jgi:hypothetical protein
MVPIFQILYLLFFLTMLIMSIFIIYHVFVYSYTQLSKMVTLMIFVPVVGVLLFTNLLLFLQIPLRDMFSSMMP